MNATSIIAISICLLRFDTYKNNSTIQAGRSHGSCLQALKLNPSFGGPRIYKKVLHYCMLYTAHM